MLLPVMLWHSWWHCDVVAGDFVMLLPETLRRCYQWHWCCCQWHCDLLPVTLWCCYQWHWCCCQWHCDVVDSEDVWGGDGAAETEVLDRGWRIHGSAPSVGDGGTESYPGPGVQCVAPSPWLLAAGWHRHISFCHNGWLYQKNHGFIFPTMLTWQIFLIEIGIFDVNSVFYIF